MTEKVEIKSDSPSRVAFELMSHIASYENISKEEKGKREYWLTLFHQSMKATKGHASLESILKLD